jgi:hypothetical protein
MRATCWMTLATCRAVVSTSRSNLTSSPYGVDVTGEPNAAAAGTNGQSPVLVHTPSFVRNGESPPLPSRDLCPHGGEDKTRESNRSLLEGFRPTPWRAPMWCRSASARPKPRERDCWALRSGERTLRRAKVTGQPATRSSSPCCPIRRRKPACSRCITQSKAWYGDDFYAKPGETYAYEFHPFRGNRANRISRHRQPSFASRPNNTESARPTCSSTAALPPASPTRSTSKTAHRGVDEPLRR